MAPAAKVEETAPETLPEDFADWDSGEPPATLPDDFNDFDDFPTIVAPPSAPAGTRASAPVSAHASAPASAPEIAHEFPLASELPSPPARPAKTRAINSNVIGSLPARSRMVAAAPVVTHEVFEPAPSEHQDFGSSLDEKHSKKSKTWLFLTLGAIPVVSLLILIPLKFYKPAAAEPAPVSQPETQQPTTTTLTMPEPRLSKPSPAQKQADSAPVTDDTPRVQSEMMRDQLNAPSRISSDIKASAQSAPPVAAFGATGMDGLGANGSGAIGSVFGKQAGLKVQGETSRPLSVSAGVAQGMLIQKTNPTYPPIAKSARVAGTVVLQATITKTGSIQGLRAVSGPVMLRQSAMDAVRTWRYRPYKLDNQPVEVDTTVMVVFNLGS
jgi:protein TonB